MSMTEAEIKVYETLLLKRIAFKPMSLRWYNIPCKVTGQDFSYVGQLLATFPKRNGNVRVLVEDENQRLFIQNLTQITLLPEEVQ